MDARERRVEREFAHRDAHALGAQIAEAEDPLPIRHDDHVDLASGPVAEHLGDAPAVVRGYVKAARPTEDLAQLLAGLAHGRRVDDGHHLRGVVEYHSVEQRLVPILKRRQENVLLQVGRLSLQVPEDALDLVVLIEDAGREQPAQPERVALGLGEGRTLVERRIM